jgi:uncharacterized membrane protein YhaH (DUF805 family)
VHHKIEVRRTGRLNLQKADPTRTAGELSSTGSTSGKKFWIAILLYGALAILAWFTIGAGSIFVNGKQVQVRLVPLVVFGVLALRTVLGRHADRIRREVEESRK